jgi:hypothetical protein
MSMMGIAASPAEASDETRKDPDKCLTQSLYKPFGMKLKTAGYRADVT